jgi:hypothetical protein
MRKPKKTSATRSAAKTTRAPARSAKAGSPPVAVKGSPAVRRRQKSAHAKLSKGTTLFETDHGPRAAWPASTSKRKKR